jgi:hypothetical protein
VRAALQSASSADLGATTAEELAFVGDVQRIEAQQFTGSAHPSRTGTASSWRITPRPQSRASSFKEVATPPRVGSRIQRIDGSAAQRAMASTKGKNRARVEQRSAFEIELAARQQNGDAVVADRAGEKNFVAGRTDAGSISIPGIGAPIPVVEMYMESALPCSTTFVSPPTIRTPASRAASPMA